MKKSNWFIRIILVCFVLIFTMCQSPQVSETIDNGLYIDQSVLQNKSPKVCGNVYALVLSGSGGTPAASGLRSFIYNIDLCTSPVTYSFGAEIKIGEVNVTSVTGLCDMPGVAGFAWAVTGQNSNFPQSLLSVNLSTGDATVQLSTDKNLQDIENYGSSGNYYAIEEGTSKIVQLDISTGTTTYITNGAPTNFLNGLTFVGDKIYAISGISGLICPPKKGDIFVYELTGGNYIGKNTYKTLPQNSNYTTNELGFLYDDCCSNNWVVGSSFGIISQANNISSCNSPNPALLLDTSLTGESYTAIYDFMIKP